MGHLIGSRVGVPCNLQQRQGQGAWHRTLLRALVPMHWPMV